MFLNNIERTTCLVEKLPSWDFYIYKKHLRKIESLQKRKYKKCSPGQEIKEKPSKISQPTQTANIFL